MRSANSDFIEVLRHTKMWMPRVATVSLSLGENPRWTERKGKRLRVGSRTRIWAPSEAQAGQPTGPTARERDV